MPGGTRTYVACYSTENNPKLENAEINSLRGIQRYEELHCKALYKAAFPK